MAKQEIMDKVQLPLTSNYQDPVMLVHNKTRSVIDLPPVDDRILEAIHDNFKGWQKGFFWAVYDPETGVLEIDPKRPAPMQPW
jgi:hypothetical protein